MLKWQQTENKNIVGFKSVILLCSEGNSVMLLSSIISCNKNVKTKMQIWSCYMKTLYLQKISCTRQIESKLSLLSFALFLQKNINRRYNYGRHNDKHREQYDTHVLERIAVDE